MILAMAASLRVYTSLFVTLLAPTVAHATGLHGSGNCVHDHLGGLNSNFCKGGVAGKKCKDYDDEAGTCKQVGRSNGANRACVTTNQERQEFQIRIMYDATKIALQFPEVISSLGLAVACSQLSPLATKRL
jgi:hypothetical protein